MSNITQVTSIETGDNGGCSVDLEKTLSLERRPATHFSSGDDSATHVLTSEQVCRKTESTAPRFATLEKRKAANLYAKRTELLMRAGLIAGITPTSVRQTLGADCRAPASSLLVGDMYELMDDERERKNASC